jgi:hypothetical protein
LADIIAENESCVDLDIFSARRSRRVSPLGFDLFK